MKKYIIILLFLAASVIPLCAQDVSNDIQHLFSSGNALYEKRDYQKAAEEYTKILDSHLESGNLYYDIGNAFFKMGKIGYAILSYEKARALIPGDSDLRSNLAYVQSLTEDSALQPQAPNRIMWLVKLPFRQLNLNTVALILLTAYVVLIAMMIFGIINNTFRRRATLLFYLLLLVFLVTLADFSARYYDEEILKHGVVVAKDAECKYEPIDKSTTYYMLKEGQEVLILDTRNGWRQIKRLDGKLAWVKKEAVEGI
jgi:tetratricopeptide (TPR) repeat protein